MVKAGLCLLSLEAVGAGQSPPCDLCWDGGCLYPTHGGDAPNSTHSNPEHFTAQQQPLFSEPGHAGIFQKLRVWLNVNRFPDRSENIILYVT